ncbi:LacI family DNA-binding transcriptional regulator [Streptomyces sp. NBC_01255]|uniref:LacI family DNA-binding transcriptional regulator n=1 Tax=Streptomyces sp. NBC_01255 TaxID=2903798 RepID=UPI002E36C483|nr:LacI family DNA-binding transcriptional regulator [Streptomyces sp. NBC_01255]
MAANSARNVTMSDVARRAGVSRTAVSSVLNDRPGAAIPDETRRRIQAAIDELGYRVEAGHERIGFINLDPDIPAALGLREGYERALREAGHPLDPSLIVFGHATADGG